MDTNPDARDLASMHHVPLVIVLWFSPLARQTAMQETHSLSLPFYILGVVPACYIWRTRVPIPLVLPQPVSSSSECSALCCNPRV